MVADSDGSDPADLRSAAGFCVLDGIGTIHLFTFLDRGIGILPMLRCGYTLSGFTFNDHGRDARATLLPTTKIKTLIIALIGVGGVLLMLAATRYGIGVYPDSTVYLDAARNLAAGSGLRVLSGRTGELIPLTHYPPLYSAVLALIAEGGTSLVSAARILNATLFGGNIILTGIAIWFYARDSFWLPVMGSILALTAVDVAGGHSIALAEPLFVFLTIIGLLSLARYLERRQRRWVLAAALATALSLLTRYVGVTTVITGCLVLLAAAARLMRAETPPPSGRNGRALRRILLDTLLFGVISTLPILSWAVSFRSVFSSAGDRQFAFHLFSLRQFVSGSSTVAQWFLLGKVSGGLRVTGFLIQIVIVGGLIVFLRRGDRVPLSVELAGRATMLPQILGGFILVNIVLLVFTASFVDADTVFDSRSLLPVHFATIILGLVVARDIYVRSRAQPARMALVVLAMLLLCSQSLRLAGWFIRTSSDGQGYASRTWIESETIRAVQQQPPNILIYSNGYDAIHYLTGRSARLIPEKIVHGTGRVNINHDRELDEMKNDLNEHRGMLVYFHNLSERTYLPSEDELRSRLSPQVRNLNDGSIFEILTK
ncbi:MAG: rane protein of unknown function [Acidobacteria bacterium]|nr:rane protein of unknown function [Acidobacteriota bacterium]